MSKFFYNSVIKKFFSLPDVKNIALDSKERTLSALRIINKKPFLKRVYKGIYEDFRIVEDSLLGVPGPSLEIGSGAGFLKEIIPNVITSDILKYDHVDRLENAYDLSFGNGELKAIYMFDVLHHLGNVELFFKEAERCLKPGGKLVLIEPHGSFWGKLQYKYLHHETYDDTVKDWKFPDVGPLSSANVALPTLIFHRDREKFKSLFPTLDIEKTRCHTFLLYVLSGGLSAKQMVPGFSFTVFNLMEKILSPLMKNFLGSFQTIILKKK